MKPSEGLYYAAKFQLARLERMPILLNDEEMYQVTDEIYRLFPDIELDDFDDDQQRQEQEYLTSIATRRYTTDNLQQTRHKLSQIVEQYEGVVVPPRAAAPQPQEDKKRQRAEQSASDNIVCKPIASSGFFEVYIDHSLIGGGVSVSGGLFLELFQASNEPILKLQTSAFFCFARPHVSETNDDRQRIGLSQVVYEVLDEPLMLRQISLCHGFPAISKIAVSGEGTQWLDVSEISEEVTKLQVLFIGLRLFKNTIYIAKLYDQDGNEMDVGKIPQGEKEIPILPISIDRRMRFISGAGRKKLNWF